MVELVDHVRLGPAELPRETQIFLGTEFLRPKDQNLRREEGIPYLAERRVDGFGFRAEGAELPDGVRGQDRNSPELEVVFMRPHLSPKAASCARKRAADR
jgi:hypothetical protein